MKQKPQLKKGVDYIGVTCVFFCHDGRGRFLLHKRSKLCQDEQGNWDAGGGSLEHGEEFEEGVRREIKEEYCTTVLDLKYLGAHNVLRKNKGKKTHWIALIFVARVDAKKVKIGEPKYMDEIGWFTKDNLPTPLHTQHPRFWPLVEDYI
ncbi:MAG: hypothetical protein ACD_30C00092G0010 [uncultured bacterium]|uniref:Nudix hydrolase domain-containing protein n=3 Tax=Candidatus Daviesiibacteriota TaxID=1752718 RepID=A0A0G0F927_9BACT|nr:MAG: hypothetical protein ACD_30C00092G0010 [uncultured bacterium]KKQ10025.1 MAG: hypothetical protein US19_C0009G0027 [Candidatus Daviesbacteria bacterium GW2011_GWB1_36_5]KKQ15913.1 MAG: hypothetical protein US28_C0007G0004 [Candidatus Daviesbacteria bacterium GW2011_GWA1_36_8]OGE35188.1 MAG: hypothetical protein A3E66_02025 [Candidatus Daviesbacteria bacterium RIFCSPHIGHO2_12_FULL_37_16]